MSGTLSASDLLLLMSGSPLCLAGRQPSLSSSTDLQSGQTVTPKRGDPCAKSTASPAPQLLAASLSSRDPLSSSMSYQLPSQLGKPGPRYVSEGEPTSVRPTSAMSEQGPGFVYVCTTDQVDQHPHMPSSALIHGSLLACTQGVRGNAVTSPSLPDELLASCATPVMATHLSKSDPQAVHPTMDLLQIASPRRNLVVCQNAAGFSPAEFDSGRHMITPSSNLSPVQVLQQVPQAICVRDEPGSSAPAAVSIPATDSHPDSLASNQATSQAVVPTSLCADKDQLSERNRALDWFKAKVKSGAFNPLQDAPSVNQFQILQEDQDDDGSSDFDCDYETDDGSLLHVGYQSADGRSKGKKHMASGLKVNKRHPNAPLNVNLRSRKRFH